MIRAPETGDKMTGENAFPRRSRLLKPAEFKNVFDRPVVSSDHLFKVFARPGTTSHYRIGLAVSRKVDRRAVGRNRIKRVIRESFRLNFPLGEPIKDQGRDYVIVASPPAARAEGEQLRNSLEKHWRTIDHKLAKRSGNAGQQINRPEE